MSGPAGGDGQSGSGREAVRPRGGEAGRRALALLGVLALVAVVAVAVRPAAPDLPPPFSVERETAGAQVGAGEAREGRPGEGADPEASGDPGDGAPGVPVPAPGRATLTIHPIDRDTLARRAERLDVPVPPGPLVTALGPGGSHLAVATPRAGLDPETVVRVYDTADLRAPPAERVVPGFVDELAFVPDGRSIVWLAHGGHGARHVAGARLGGAGGGLGHVVLPPGTRVHDVAALRADRVGVVLASVPPAGEAGPGRLRLAVADLGAGELAVDVALPVTHVAGGAGERRTDLVAGVAWDPARGRAYVAHPDRDAVLAMDLADPHESHEFVVADPGVALADADGGVWRQATLSGDGAMLYVHGVRSRGADAPATQLASPRASRLPLLAFDLEAGGVVGGARAPRVRVLATGPDAGHLAVLDGDPDGAGGLALRLLDGRTLDEHWRRALDGAAPPYVRFSETGRVVAVAGPDLERGPVPPTTRVELFESTGGRRLAVAAYTGVLVDLHLDAGLLLVRSLD